MHEAFYGKNNGVFRVCANSVYQASPRGGGAGEQGYIMSGLCNPGGRGRGTRLHYEWIVQPSMNLVDPKSLSVVMVGLFCVVQLAHKYQETINT